MLLNARNLTLIIVTEIISGYLVALLCDDNDDDDDGGAMR